MKKGSNKKRYRKICLKPANGSKLRKTIPKTGCGMTGKKINKNMPKATMGKTKHGDFATF